MKNKLLILLPILILAMVGIVYGADTTTCAFDIPAASTEGTGSTYLKTNTAGGVNISINVSIAAGLTPPVNATVANLTVSTGTLGGSISLLRDANSTNNFNFTVVVSAIPDTSGAITFTASIKNQTSTGGVQTEVATCTRIYYMNNSLPAVSSVQDSAGTALSGNIQNDASIYGTISNSTTCDLYFNTNTETNRYFGSAMGITTSGITSSGGTATYKWEGHPDPAYYNRVYWQCSDGLDTVSGSSIALNIDSSVGFSGAPKTPTEKAQEKAKAVTQKVSNPLLLVGLAVISIILVVIVIVILSESKKAKKKARKHKRG